MHKTAVAKWRLYRYSIHIIEKYMTAATITTPMTAAASTTAELS